MPIVANSDLYEKVKKEADKKYSKPSAYKSGWIVQRYKELGGKYIDDGKPKKLKRWFREEWRDINPFKTETSYPVYRPTKRISPDTPKTLGEIAPEKIQKQSILKQFYRGNKNLPVF